MSYTSVPDKLKLRLWLQAGGRCQYAGCNKPLWRDELTMVQMNKAYIAHIIADSPNGPRGDSKLSLQLAAEISNVMLMCDEHHRLIDREGLADHPVDLLRQMKLEHEQRIEIVTGIDRNRKSHILLYGANVGDHSSPVSYSAAAPAILSDGRYPASSTALILGMINSSFRDRTDGFWKIESEHLRVMIQQQVRPQLASGSIQHLSIFAFGPQPLLILLGYLLSDIPAAQVYQLHREPPGWYWEENPSDFAFSIHEPDRIKGEPALVLSLSATVTDDRIVAALGEDVTIWRISIAEPNNDFLKSSRQLQQFRETIRKLMDKIKAKHGQRTTLHIFPAVPVSIAVELGRILMPKADMPLRVYDQNNERNGFISALDIGS